MITIGNNNFIAPSCVIGSKGFSFPKSNPRTILNPTHDIIIGDNNYIASLSNIDTGIKRDTVIGDNNIIDSHVHISHDVQIGNNCEIDTGSILLGFVTLGDNVRICTGAIVHPFVKINNGSVLGANSYLRHDLPPDVIAYGSPAEIKENTKYADYLLNLYPCA